MLLRRLVRLGGSMDRMLLPLITVVVCYCCRMVISLAMDRLVRVSELVWLVVVRLAVCSPVVVLRRLVLRCIVSL